MTLDSDEESPIETAKRSKPSKASKEVDEAQLDPAFTFDLSGDPYDDLLQEGTNFADVVKRGSKPVRPRSICVHQLTEAARPGTNIRRRYHSQAEVASHF